MLVVGGSGLLGGQVARQAVAAGDQVAISHLSRRPSDLPTGALLRLDLRDPVDIGRVIDDARPELIINAAYAYQDWQATAAGPAHLALAARDRAIRLVQVSSDAVFSGRDVHYDESAAPDPINSYGAAKAAAETAVAAILPSAVIVRTSLIIGHGRSNHERLVHALAGGRPGALFTDDIRCPVHVDDLSVALLELGRSDRSGIHHVAGADAISRYELGTMIAERDGLDPATLRPGLRVDSPTPGPLDVRLDSTRTQQVLRTRLRGATEFLRR